MGKITGFQKSHKKLLIIIIINNKILKITWTPIESNIKWITAFLNNITLLPTKIFSENMRILENDYIKNI